jgi:Replication-relaxation
MPNPKRQKFIRVGATDPLKLTLRDQEFLRAVYEFRFLNTEQLLALYDGSRRNITERLSRLYHHGYLDRPEVQKTKNLVSSHIVYSLDRKGVDVLSGDAKEREGILRRVREVNNTSALISHALMISQFRICLTLALKKYPDVKLTRWVQGNDLKVLLQQRGENAPLVADAYFVLENDEFEYPCFLEADRATETEARFVSKLQMYWRHNRERSFEPSLGVSHFRVLTITPNEKRAENLCRAAMEADDKREGSGLYLFLSEKKYSLTKPEAILSPIWASPKGEGRGIIE